MIRIVTPPIKAEMIFMGKVVGAEEAYRIYLINKVVPLDQVSFF
jgi:enoyl-CoA hydratase/carnithine racemase